MLGMMFNSDQANERMGSVQLYNITRSWGDERRAIVETTMDRTLELTSSIDSLAEADQFSMLARGMKYPPREIVRKKCCTQILMHNKIQIGK
jgi:hypothetical protein